MRRTVLIVDDDAPFRRAARELLTLEGYEVVGEAEDGESGVAAAARLGPAIVLLDVQLPDIACMPRGTRGAPCSCRDAAATIAAAPPRARSRASSSRAT